MRIFHMPDVIRYPSMTTSQPQESFLLDDLFQSGNHSERVCQFGLDCDWFRGAAAPAVALPTYPELRADCFTERREQGVLNIGGLGKYASTPKRRRAGQSRLPLCWSGQT